jgi:predicted nucleic acid-binding protein
MKQGFVLDSFAVLAWLKNAEPSSSTVNQILLSGSDVAMSAINVGEVVYILQKRFRPSQAELFLKRLPNLPFEIVTPSLQDILEAAALKARYPIAYADAFAAQLALKRERPLVTGDPEFKAIAGLELVWLEPDGK